MVKEEKLNILVEEYRNGDERALETLAKMFLPIINGQSQLIWHAIEDETAFECRCLSRIKTALRNYKPSKGKLRNLVINVIMKEKFDFLARRRREQVDMRSLNEPDYFDSDGKGVPFEVEDVLANIENQLIEQENLNQKVALLAKGDSRRMAILNAWAGGQTNDLELAKELAKTFPETKVTGHRRFIQRFRTECQRRLAGAI